MLLVWRVVCWGDWAVNGAITLVFMENCRFVFKNQSITRYNSPFTPWNIFPEQSRTQLLSFQSTLIISLFLSLQHYELCL